jgi:hypothetical protein
MIGSTDYCKYGCLEALMYIYCLFIYEAAKEFDFLLQLNAIDEVIVL